MMKQAQEIDKRINGIDLSIRKQAQENEEGTIEQTKEIEKRIEGINLSIRNQAQEIDQRFARLEKLILDMNKQLSHNN